tara:strand:- start:1164 stop:1301 length:138 start_codon:yes stop_codon:yes gene_type:complete
MLGVLFKAAAITAWLPRLPVNPSVPAFLSEPLGLGLLQADFLDWR